MRKSRKGHLGDLPTYKDGPNKGRLIRNEVSKMYQFSLDQINKAYLNWTDTYRYESTTLTFEQYLNKLKLKSLTPDDIGLNNDQYNLARINDEGGYHDNNCRFIERIDNLNEQKHPPLSLESIEKIKINNQRTNESRRQKVLEWRRSNIK